MQTNEEKIRGARNIWLKFLAAEPDPSNWVAFTAIREMAEVLGFITYDKNGAMEFTPEGPQN